MNGNAFVAFLLRSPLHRVMGKTMLITVAGRRSGRSITTPVNYCRSGATLWILSSRDRTWWRNIDRGTPVKLRLDGREVLASAELVQDENAVAAQLGEYLQQLPAAARALGIRTPGGIPDTKDTLRLAGSRLFIKVRLP